MEIRCSEVSSLSYMPQHVVLGRLMSMHMETILLATCRYAARDRDNSGEFHTLLRQIKTVVC